MGRLKVLKASDEDRMAQMGISDPNRLYRTEDLAPGKHIIFAATGVTSGDLLKGARFFGDGARTESLVMSTSPRYVRSWTPFTSRKETRSRFASERSVRSTRISHLIWPPACD